MDCILRDIPYSVLYYSVHEYPWSLEIRFGTTDNVLCYSILPGSTLLINWLGASHFVTFRHYYIAATLSIRGLVSMRVNSQWERQTHTRPVGSLTRLGGGEGGRGQGCQSRLKEEAESAASLLYGTYLSTRLPRLWGTTGYGSVGMCAEGRRGVKIQNFRCLLAWHHWVRSARGSVVNFEGPRRALQGRTSFSLIFIRADI